MPQEIEVRVPALLYHVFHDVVEQTNGAVLKFHPSNCRSFYTAHISWYNPDAYACFQDLWAPYLREHQQTMVKVGLVKRAKRRKKSLLHRAVSRMASSYTSIIALFRLW